MGGRGRQKIKKDIPSGDGRGERWRDMFVEGTCLHAGTSGDQVSLRLATAASRKSGGGGRVGGLSQRKIEPGGEIRDMGLNNLGQKSETAARSSCGLT